MGATRIYEQATDELVSSIRIAGSTFQPSVLADITYKLIVGEDPPSWQVVPDVNVGDPDIFITF